jgi:hypothetical protein
MAVFTIGAVMKVETCRLSSSDCFRVIQPGISIRSNKRDILDATLADYAVLRPEFHGSLQSLVPDLSQLHRPQ